MLIDASIIGRGVQEPDWEGAARTFATLGQIGSQLKQQQLQRDKIEKAEQRQGAIDSAYKDAYDPETGKVDRKAVLSNLGKGGLHRELAAEQARGVEMEKHQLGKQREQMGLVSQLLGGVTDQQSYEGALSQAQKYGIPVDDMPGQFDPQLVRRYQMQALSASEQLDQQLKAKKFDVDKRKADAEVAAINNPTAKLNSRLSPAEKKVDQEFAKEYSDWTSGGAKIALSEIQKLEGVVKDLEDEKVTTGGLTGLFPDRVTSDEVLSARSDVQSTVMNSLRAILGAQFTEKEGERIIKNTWNEADSTENNKKRLSRLVADLKGKAADKQKKSLFYEQNKTLSGYRYSHPGNTLAKNDRRTFKTKEIEWAD